MKSILVFTLLLVGAVFLQFCSSSRSAADSKSKADATTVTYANDVAPIMVDRCAPCHFPDGGKVKFLDTYGAVSNNIGDILERVGMAPHEEGFMPFESKREPLSDSLIMVLKTWQASGMAK